MKLFCWWLQPLSHSQKFAVAKCSDFICCTTACDLVLSLENFFETVGVRLTGIACFIKLQTAGIVNRGDYTRDGSLFRFDNV